MREIFYPKNVATIGVSSRPTNIGRNVVSNLIEYGFDGIVYPVGPRGGIVKTHRIYRSVADIPDRIDLAVIITPANTVSGILEECGQKGIRWAIIETAGFGEYGAEGRRLEQEIAEVADRYKIRFVGPNCIGVINMENGLCVPLDRLTKFVKPGGVSIITQSGGIGIGVLNMMANEGVGLDKFVSVGNMLNINAEDMLEYFVEDEETDLIFLYLETIGDGRRLMEAARRSSKPILALKANVGTLGQDVAASHTASLSSDDKVVDAAFRQAGVLRIHDTSALGNSMKMLLYLPPMREKNLAIISPSGGHAVIAADTCEQSVFNLAHFPQSFLHQIEGNFGSSVIRLGNPLDIGNILSWDMYPNIVDRMLQLQEVDGIALLDAAMPGEEPQARRARLDRIIKLVQEHDKPVAYCIFAEAEELGYLKQHYKFPIFTEIVDAIQALEMSYRQYCQSGRLDEEEKPPEFHVKKGAVETLIRNAKVKCRDLLLSEAMDVLSQYDIPIVESRTATSISGAISVAEHIGFPIAIKVLAGEISHKSDVGGVQLDLLDKEALEVAWDEMKKRIHCFYPDVNIEGMLVQPMVTAGRELIIGGRQDPQFGPILLVGLGGMFVEIFDDVAVRIAPISREDAQHMIEELRGVQIFEGARGDKPLDINSVVDVLLRLSQLLIDFPEIKEVDINPLRLFHAGEGCMALDARILL